jgi:queuosine precursor transporter
MSILFYILTILIANVVTSAFHPFHLLWFLIPYGTLLIGLTLLSRNYVQARYGRKAVYITIIVALILSAIASHVLGDTLAVTIASAISFAISETSDTEVFTRLRKSMYIRVLSGGTVGGILDSIIFVIIGLSPIGAGFVPWPAIPMAIAGQLLVKVIMQALGGIVVAKTIRVATV